MASFPLSCKVMLISYATVISILSLFHLSIVVKAQQFFIYNWSIPNLRNKGQNNSIWGSLGDLYPPPTAILDPAAHYNHKFYSNNGIGELISGKYGLFHTWQFSLYKNIMQRLYYSINRTRDPYQACAYIVPFDLGVHSYVDHVDGRYRLPSPFGWNANELLRKSQRDKIIWKNFGHDHFIIMSLTAFHMVGIGVKTFIMTICENCTVITIETTPTTSANAYYTNRHRKNWYAVPYPSSYHWWIGIEELPWAINNNNKNNRHIFALFVGSTRTTNIQSNNFRKLLYSQCVGNLKYNCKWVSANHSCDGVVNATSEMLLFKSSTFCLAPPGDSITRKSLFDALVSGCIPVIFARASLSQYLWHLSKEEIANVSVYIPKQSIVKDGNNFIDILSDISEKKIYLMQKSISLIAPKLQYSLVPPEDVLKRNSSTNQKYLTFTPPFLDAVDIIIEKILNKSTIFPMNGYTLLELKTKVCTQIDIMANHEDYTGMNSIAKYQNNDMKTSKGYKQDTEMMSGV
eukprot:gene13775-18478_t